MDFTKSFAALENITSNSDKHKVPKKEYEVFCKEFVFEKLQGHSFGYAFCTKFGFNPFFLESMSDENAKYLIENLGYIE